MATWSCFGPVMLCLRAQLLVFLSLNPAGTTQGHCSWTSDPQTWLWMAGRHQQCGKVGVAATWGAVSKNSFDKETIALVLYLNLSQLMRVLSNYHDCISCICWQPRLHPESMRSQYHCWKQFPAGWRQQICQAAFATVTGTPFLQLPGAFPSRGRMNKKWETHQPGAEEFNWDPQVLVFFF